MTVFMPSEPQTRGPRGLCAVRPRLSALVPPRRRLCGTERPAVGSPVRRLAAGCEPALARARNAVRLCLRRHRRLSPHRRAGLDFAAHAFRSRARRHRRALDRGTVLSSLLAASQQPGRCAFRAAVAWGIGRPIFASRNRNWYFVALVLALGAASIAFQAYPRAALAAGLDMVLLVIAIMAGRVIPAFTNNAVRRSRRAPQPLGGARRRLAR